MKHEVREMLARMGILVDLSQDELIERLYHDVYKRQIKIMGDLQNQINTMEQEYRSLQQEAFFLDANIHDYVEEILGYIKENYWEKFQQFLKEEEKGKPLYRIAFTGHRPNKIGGYDPKHPQRVAVTDAISSALRRAVAKYGQTHEVVVISGGALGVDTDAAREANKMGLRFVIAAPCRGQDGRWPAKAKETYRKMCRFADAELAQQLCSDSETVEGGVIYVTNTGYTGAKVMQDRNIWMVDHADAVVAIWDGSSGGTANCVGYAKEQHKPMVIINPKQ